MDRIFDEISGPCMAIQTLVIVVTAGNADGIRRSADVLHIDSCYPAQFVSQRAKKRIVGMAGEAGLSRRYAVILKMNCGYVFGIIHIKAPPERFHAVTRNAKLRLF